MKRLLNTLYVFSPGTHLSREGACVRIHVPERKPILVPTATLDGIVCFAQVTHSAPLLDHCVKVGITLTHLSEYGRFIARLEGPVSGNVMLRREQYRRMDDPPACADIVRCILTAKLANGRNVLLRANRDNSENNPTLTHTANTIKTIGDRLERTTELNQLRGLEGEAAAIYWGVFNLLIKSQEKAFIFSTRSRRPPLDPVNALLSFVYTLLTHDIRSAMETVGLDPQAGYLHRLRPGRPSLALDIIEEFRAPVADRLVLSLINRGQVTPKGFKLEPNGATLMTDQTKRTVVTAYQDRKKESITHPFLNEEIPLGLIWHTQALLLARHLRGDLDGYPAFFWR